jgi:hypothetical protein
VALLELEGRRLQAACCKAPRGTQVPRAPFSSGTCNQLNQQHAIRCHRCKCHRSKHDSYWWCSRGGNQLDGEYGALARSCLTLTQGRTQVPSILIPLMAAANGILSSLALFLDPCIPRLCETAHVYAGASTTVGRMSKWQADAINCWVCNYCLRAMGEDFEQTV